MAEYQITYWQEIPSLVTAREGRRNRASVELPQRFQVAIDEAAMRAGMTGTDAYMEQWRRSEWQIREGTPETVAVAVAAELETDYSPQRIREILRGYGSSA
ncbi:MAG: virulence factor [Caldilineaceae bacterium]|nr:virulence factor [Caldilineaceae bacterium]